MKNQTYKTRTNTSQAKKTLLLILILTSVLCVNLVSGTEWNLSHTLTNAAGDINSVDFSQNNNYLAVGSLDKKTYVYSMSNWSLNVTLTTEATIPSVAFSQNNYWLAVVTTPTSTNIYDVGNWSNPKNLTNGTNVIYESTFSRNNNWLAIGRADDYIRIHNTTNWSVIESLRAASSNNAVAFSRDSGLLASGVSSFKTYLYNTTDWSNPKNLTDGADTINSISFSNDWMAIGRGDDIVYIYDAADWSPETNLTDAAGDINSVDFSEDNNYLAVGSADNKTYIYDTSDWSLEATLTNATDDVLSVSFSQDNRYLAVGSADNKTYIYDTSIISAFGSSLISPSDNSILSVIGANFTANYSVTNYNLTNATYYLWNSTGVFNNSMVVTITGTSNSTTEYIDDFVLGNYEWNVWACWGNATFSNCSFADSNYSFIVGATINTEDYNNATYETSSETFITNLTLLSGTNFYDAQISYNGTLYEGTITDLGDSKYSISATLDIPLINVSSQDYVWYWKLTYEKADETFIFQNLSSNNQNVSQINLFTSNCVAGENSTLNFSAYDEGDLSVISNFSFYGTFEYWLGTGDVRKNISVSNSSVENNLLFCIYPNNYTYYSNAKIQYEKIGFIKRSHYLINSSLTNTTNDIGLYLLNSSSSTSFIINIIDEVQFPVTNAYVYVQRYYPGSGIFHTVEMGKTDDSGNTIGHFEAETEDYKVIIFKEGVILYESEMQKVFCGETPCTLSFQIQAIASTVWQNIGDLPNLIWSLTYNEITKFWTYTYVDTSGTANFGRLLVYIEDGRNRIIICNKTDTSSAATLTCNCSGYDGTIYAEAYISRSPEILVWLESIGERVVKAIFGMEGLFWATIIILLIGLIGVWNPSIGIIMMIAGVILINFLQIASLGTVTIMGIVVMGGLLLWGMKKP